MHNIVGASMSKSLGIIMAHNPCTCVNRLLLAARWTRIDLKWLLFFMETILCEEKVTQIAINTNINPLDLIWQKLSYRLVLLRFYFHLQQNSTIFNQLFLNS